MLAYLGLHSGFTRCVELVVLAMRFLELKVVLLEAVVVDGQAGWGLCAPAIVLGPDVGAGGSAWAAEWSVTWPAGAGEAWLLRMLWREAAVSIAWFVFAAVAAAAKAAAMDAAVAA